MQILRGVATQLQKLTGQCNKKELKMAYISATEVKAIRNELKAQFPKFKFGVRKGAGSLSVDVTVKSGPIDFVENHSQTIDHRHVDARLAEGYLQVNQYWFQDHFTGEAKDAIDQFLRIIKIAPSTVAGGRRWFDESDVRSDYFHTAYYIHLQIGAWNQPYALVK